MSPLNVKEDPVFRAGRFVRAEVELATHRDTKIIPKSALIYQDADNPSYTVALLEKARVEDENQEEEEVNDVAEEKELVLGLFGSSEEEKNEEEKKQEDENKTLQRGMKGNRRNTFVYI